MTKKRSFLLSVSLMLLAMLVMGSIYVSAGQSTPRTREDIASLRASRPARAKSAKAPVSRVHAGDKQLYAFHCFTDFGDLEGWAGLVKVLAGPTCPEKVHKIDGVPFQASYMNGKALVVLYDAFNKPKGNVTYQVYDTETWALETSVNYTYNSPNMLPYGLAYDHTTDKVYGCFFASTFSFVSTKDAQFGYIDFAKGLEPVTIVSESLPTRMRAMTFDADGTLYAMSFEGDMYTINKFTGEATSTGVHIDLPVWDGGDVTDPSTTYGRESMCCDWESGDFFITYGDDLWNTYVGRFNPKTSGKATIVADYSYSDYFYGSEDCNVLTGLYFVQSAVTPVKITPAAPTAVTATAVGTELKATVSFTMPTVDSEGEALDKDMTWTITDGDNELGTGTAHSGEQVSTTVEVSAGGRNTFVVTATLDGSVSNPGSASTFIGCDTPVIYGLPTVRAAGMKLTVSWTAATAANYGNLDPVTYKVTRMPDDVVVAEANESTTFVDEITSDIKTLYYYLIQPVSGTVEGEAVASRSLYAGKYLAVPLEENFDDEQRFLQYPVIDANGDDNIWEFSTKNEGAAVYPANGKPADDYLLIGPFKMKAGELYSFHMTANGHNYNETIALYVGTDESDVTTFTTELVAPTLLEPSKGTKSIDASFEPSADGDYYFGIKACSANASSQFIYVYEVVVKAIGGAAPAAPAEFELIPEAKSATIKFTLSDKCINGSEADKLSEVHVYRDNSLIATITEGVAAGASLTYTDKEEVSKGYHIYSVAAVNAEGEGKAASGQLWRGADFPGRPSNLRIWEDLETPGLMHITFDHPKRGYYGGYVNPNEIYYLVRYLVMGKASGVLELGYGTEHTFKLPFTVDAQDIFAGSVYGRNSEGSVASSSNWITSTGYFGPAMTLPLHDSWAGMSQQSKGVWSGQNIDENAGVSDTYWDTHDGTEGNIRPQDNDGGFKSLTSTVDNGSKRMLSPRVTLAGAESPTMVFYYMYDKNALEFNLEIIVDDQPIKVLKSFDLNESGANKWTRMEIPLDAYKSSKYIQLAFAGRANKGENVICVDNVTISDLKPNNLSVISFTAPYKVAVNEEAAIVLGVRNNGSAKVKGSDYVVKFYKNDEVFAEIAGNDIDPDVETSFTASDYPTVADPSECSYYAMVDYAADKNPADNTSARSTMRVVIAEYPTVCDLSATQREGVELTWSDPDMSQIPGVSVTETFESYESFIIENIGPWTLHDGDGCNTVMMATSMGVLEYPHIGEKMAWQVFDPNEAAVPNAAWYARSGSKMLVSFQAASDGEGHPNMSEDWLISPELNGSAQEISFYARAGLAMYAPEYFEFLISDKTNAIGDFKPLASDVEVPYSADTWTEYVYRVPAGTRYFAIVHNSFGKLAMMVDDITYIPAGSAPVKLDLEGFNVYRDGKRLTSEPVGDNSYTDTDIEIGKQYTYRVSAVWDKGESRLSDPVTLTTTSVDNATTYSLTISGHQGYIRISGGIGEKVAVYTTSGVCIANTEVDGTVEIPVGQPGIYVVRAGEASAKIAVR